MAASATSVKWICSSYAIIDPKHEQRACQHQQIDDAANHRNTEERLFAIVQALQASVTLPILSYGFSHRLFITDVLNRCHKTFRRSAVVRHFNSLPPAPAPWTSLFIRADWLVLSVNALLPREFIGQSEQVFGSEAGSVAWLDLLIETPGSLVARLTERKR